MPSQVPSRIATTIGRNIAHARCERGWTQRHLAALVNGVDSQAVSRWERGVVSPSDTNLLRLAEVFDRSYGWFYVEQPEPQEAA